MVYSVLWNMDGMQCIHVILFLTTFLSCRYVSVCVCVSVCVSFMFSDLYDINYFIKTLPMHFESSIRFRGRESAERDAD